MGTQPGHQLVHRHQLCFRRAIQHAVLDLLLLVFTFQYNNTTRSGSKGFFHLGIIFTATAMGQNPQGRQFRPQPARQQQGLFDWYSTVAKTFPDLPIIVYNIPSRVVVNIGPDLLAELATIDNGLPGPHSSAIGLPPWNRTTMLATINT